jgi:hypothetical protein
MPKATAAAIMPLLRYAKKRGGSPGIRWKNAKRCINQTVKPTVITRTNVILLAITAPSIGCRVKPAAWAKNHPAKTR